MPGRSLVLLATVLLTVFSSKAQFQFQDNSFLSTPSSAEANRLNRFLTPADTFDRRRFWVGMSTAGALYATASIGLWQAWYKDYDLSGLHLKDDRHEWLGMDKLGHIYTAYHYARWANEGLVWAGTPEKKRLLLAAGTSILLQSTVEVMDGFATKWGFSLTDMSANLLGTGLFTGQQLLWHEQRINLKVSNKWIDYSQTAIPALNTSATSSAARRADHLYGRSVLTRYIKDYNAQTLWLTANPFVLAGNTNSKWSWLNVAVGYSGRNILGAESNLWVENGARYDASQLYPRQREYVLSLAVDFERIPTRSPLLKTIFHLINHFKLPAPAVVYVGGRPTWNWFYY